MMWKLLAQISLLSRRRKSVLLLIADFILLPLALLSAIVLREGTLDVPFSRYIILLVLAPLSAIPLFIHLGLYRAVVRYMDALVWRTVFIGVTLSVLVLGTVVALARIDSLPRTSLAIYWLFAIFYIGASRFGIRGLIQELERHRHVEKRVAIYGADFPAVQLAQGLLAAGDYRPVAFFDDVEELLGVKQFGVTVYSVKQIEQVLIKQDIHLILIAKIGFTQEDLRQLFRRLESLSVQIRWVPQLESLLVGGGVEVFQEIQIDDLLGREPVEPIQALIGKNISGLSVMVTGAGGSIGSELCRQIIQQQPKRLVLFELNEFALYTIEQELKLKLTVMQSDIELIPFLGNVLDKALLISILKSNNVQTIYHAAAYKHVPLVEANPIQGVMNNSFGTESIARAALLCNVQTFVLISSDKAVRPTNVMGASKRLAELILQALAAESNTTKFCMVRFGNVLGSSGSVVPLFTKQIAQGGPVTVTHPDITRYFMTIPEAVQLVLQAGAMGSGGDVFVLDMGLPVRIADLARRMIHLAGHTPRRDNNAEGDIEICYSGLRPGEKLYEELLICDDAQPTAHSRIMRAHEQYIVKDLKEKLIELYEICQEKDSKALIDALINCVDGYLPRRV